MLWLRHSVISRLPVNPGVTRLQPAFAREEISISEGLRMSETQDAPLNDDLKALAAAVGAEFARVAVDGTAFTRLAIRELRARKPEHYASLDSLPQDEEPAVSLHPESTLRLLRSLPDAAGTTAFFGAWCRYTFRARPA